MIHYWFIKAIIDNSSLKAILAVIFAVMFVIWLDWLIDNF